MGSPVGSTLSVAAGTRVAPCLVGLGACFALALVSTWDQDWEGFACSLGDCLGLAVAADLLALGTALGMSLLPSGVHSSP